MVPNAKGLKALHCHLLKDCIIACSASNCHWLNAELSKWKFLWNPNTIVEEIHFQKCHQPNFVNVVLGPLKWKEYLVMSRPPRSNSQLIKSHHTWYLECLYTWWQWYQRHKYIHGKKYIFSGNYSIYVLSQNTIVRAVSHYNVVHGNRMTCSMRTKTKEQRLYFEITNDSPYFVQMIQLAQGGPFTNMD